LEHPGALKDPPKLRESEFKGYRPQGDALFLEEGGCPMIEEVERKVRMDGQGGTFRR